MKYRIGEFVRLADGNTVAAIMGYRKPARYLVQAFTGPRAGELVECDEQGIKCRALKAWVDEED
jgi:hypothetical protein